MENRTQAKEPSAKRSRPRTGGRRQPAGAPRERSDVPVPQRAEWTDAFVALPPELLRALTQQFPQPEMCVRELGQNSGDAAARNIFCNYTMENVSSEGFDFVVEWLDDGRGMTWPVVQNNYLDLLHSSKNEEQGENVGRHGAGRLAILAIPGLIDQETVTLAAEANAAGYRVLLLPDGTGEVSEIDQAVARERLAVTGAPMKPQHGTLVRFRYRMKGGEAAFAAEVQKINRVLHQELRFIRSKLTATTATYDAPEGGAPKLVLGTECVNQPFGVPGRLSKAYPFALAKGGGTGTVSVGIRPDDKQPMPDLPHLTLTAGGIPLERLTGMRWCARDRSFNIANLRIIIDSYDWHPPIGRHRVKRDAFFGEVVPKVFEKIVVQGYLPCLAGQMAGPHARGALMGYLYNLETMFFDLLNESILAGFPVPEAVMSLPLFPRFGHWGRNRTLSVRDLEKCGHFYYTTQKPDLADWRSLADTIDQPDKENMVVLDLYNCSSYAVSFLEHGFGPRAERVYERFLIKDDTSELGVRINAQLRQSRIARFAPAAHRVLCVGRFIQLGSEAPETATRSHADKERGRIHLNAHHPDVVEMLKLAADENPENRFLGLHFLLREALMAQGLEISERERRQALQRHTASRFKSGNGDADDGDDRHVASLHDLIRQLAGLAADADAAGMGLRRSARPGKAKRESLSLL